jgi:uncharacterized RDD family membrane protein YckC
MTGEPPPPRTAPEATATEQSEALRATSTGWEPTDGRPPPPYGEIADARNEPPPRFVGLVTRVIALALDALLIDAVALAVTGAVLLLFSIFSISSRHHEVALLIGGGLFIVWVVCYFAGFWTTTGQTPGDRVMQIRVIRADGSELRPRHAIVRLAGMVLSLPLFWGYVPILLSARRRGAFDVMAGTVVIAAAPASPERPDTPSTARRGAAAARDGAGGAARRVPDR